MARISIAKISDDPKVQELLKAFDTNDDKHLETKEIDADGDGQIDCNQITQKWMYTKLGPVENALFRAGLVSKLRNAVCRTDLNYDKPYLPDWNDKFDGKSDISPYLDLVNIAREKKIRVIAIDVDPDYYIENSQTDPLVVGTRNLVWANQISTPPQGERGLVFGGSAHFEWNPGIRVQDFLAEKIPPSDMAIITFKK